MSAGSELEPQPSGPENAAEQMRQATTRLRHRAWMVTPLSKPTFITEYAADEEEQAAG